MMRWKLGVHLYFLSLRLDFLFGFSLVCQGLAHHHYMGSTHSNLSHIADGWDHLWLHFFRFVFCAPHKLKHRLNSSKFQKNRKFNKYFIAIRNDLCYAEITKRVHAPHLSALYDAPTPHGDGYSFNYTITEDIYS